MIDADGNPRCDHCGKRLNVKDTGSWAIAYCPRCGRDTLVTRDTLKMEQKVAVRS